VYVPIKQVQPRNSPSKAVPFVTAAYYGGLGVARGAGWRGLVRRIAAFPGFSLTQHLPIGMIPMQLNSSPSKGGAEGPGGAKGQRHKAEGKPDGHVRGTKPIGRRFPV
jgi:hypothetical protein